MKKLIPVVSIDGESGDGPVIYRLDKASGVRHMVQDIMSNYERDCEMKFMVKEITAFEMKTAELLGLSYAGELTPRQEKSLMKRLKLKKGKAK